MMEKEVAQVSGPQVARNSPEQVVKDLIAKLREELRNEPLDVEVDDDKLMTKAQFKKLSLQIFKAKKLLSQKLPEAFTFLRINVLKKSDEVQEEFKNGEKPELKAKQECEKLSL